MRMWRNGDFEPYLELCSDTEVMHFLGGKALDRYESAEHKLNQGR
jgi:hypothetical protein